MCQQANCGISAIGEFLRGSVSSRYERTDVGGPSTGTAYYVCQITDCFISRMRSIRQSVQNGQFLCRLAQDASDLFVASHTDKRIERFLRM